MPKVKKKAKAEAKAGDNCEFCPGVLVEIQGNLCCQKCHRVPGQADPEVKAPEVIHPPVGPRRSMRP